MGIILKPFAWLLLFFYDFFQSYGVALILFALVVKIILFPLSLKGKKSMIQMNLLSGRMQQLQKQYGKDRERYNLEIQKLYEKEKVNPMGGCLWSFLPLAILIPLYYIIREPLINLMDVPKDLIQKMAEVTGIANVGAYPQIAMAEALNQPGMLDQAKTALGEAGNGLFQLDFSFLGLNLADVPKWNFWTDGFSWATIGLFLLPILSVGISLLSMQVSLKTNQMNQNQQNEAAAKTNRTMMILMPMMSLWIGFTVPAGLSIYWIAQYIFTIFQELICGKLLKKDYEAARAAAAERERQEKEEEKRRKEEARQERARRIEEEKKNRGKKKPAKKHEPAEPGINKEDSRVGIRAYARGRAYDPNRFGGVTDYMDPSDIIARQEAERAAGKGKKKEKSEQNPQQERPTSDPKPVVEEPQVEETQVEETQVEKPVTLEEPTVPVHPPVAPVELEEVEIEVEQVEVELPEDDDKKEGV